MADLELLNRRIDAQLILLRKAWHLNGVTAERNYADAYTQWATEHNKAESPKIMLPRKRLRGRL